MYAVRAQALALLRMPDGDGSSTAGPTFEWVPKDRRGAGAHG
jgi:L-2-hydroxyglutarate oxidase LhgO